MLPCRRCVRAAASLRAHPRHISQSARRGETQPSPRRDDGHDSDSKDHDEQSEKEEENRAMSHRLQQATEDALLTGGRQGRRAVQDAGFSDDLKEHLLDRIARANIASIEQQPPPPPPPPSSAAAAAPAAAQPWTGEETTSAAVHRMLDDAHKPLRPVAKPRPAPRITPGQRAARAREKAAIYSEGLSDAERARLREDFRARFDAVPATLSGLAALADERIEEAMARGLFRDLPDRGRPVAEDPLARNPFVDRTEFLMNRIIQRQEIVPPWIEKQQELGRAVAAFRARLRAEWKRHAARMIAAAGGTLEEQMRRAEGHAEAEAGAAAAAAATAATDSLDGEDGKRRGVRVRFRDRAWEEAEHAYLKLSVENLNGLVRSYNLMAPELAKKPYYTLERELARCFRDVAPHVAGEIKNRASQLRARDPGSRAAESQTGEKGEGGMGGEARVYVREGKGYGLREWWNDVRQNWRSNN